MTIEEKFRKSLEEGYKKYLTIHPRSNKKIVPVHRCIAEIIQEKLGGERAGYSVKSLGLNDKEEFKLKGQYYEKGIDITILFENQSVSGLGFKFITSNYKQNSNNYFEGMLGETANLRRTGFLYGQILVFKYKMPYFSSKRKTFTKIERINEQNIAKYVKLHNDNEALLYHKPDLLYIGFIETGDEAAFEQIVKLNEEGNYQEIDKQAFYKSQVEKVHVKFISPGRLSKKDFSEKTLEFLKKVSNFDLFIDAFVHLTKGKTYGK